MNKNKLIKYKEKLESIRDEILNSTNGNSENVVLQRGGDIADIANFQISTSVMNALTDIDRIKIQEINHALKKIEVGNFGICEGTQKKISEARLTYIPWTRYTAEYASLLEKKNQLDKIKNLD